MGATPSDLPIPDTAVEGIDALSLGELLAAMRTGPEVLRDAAWA